MGSLNFSKAAIALLGVVALRAYTSGHQEKTQSEAPEGDTAPAAPGGGLGGSLGGMLGSLGGGGLAGGLGGLLGGAMSNDTVRQGLGDLVNHLTQAGHGETAQSWVGNGPNAPVSSNQLEQAIGSDTIDKLTKETGLSRDDLLARLSQHLPGAVDGMTPHGQVPSS